MTSFSFWVDHQTRGVVLGKPTQENPIVTCSTSVNTVRIEITDRQGSMLTSQIEMMLEVWMHEYRGTI
jgi:hypothetical protein